MQVLTLLPTSETQTTQSVDKSLYIDVHRNETINAERDSYSYTEYSTWLPYLVHTRFNLTISAADNELFDAWFPPSIDY